MFKWQFKFVKNFTPSEVANVNNDKLLNVNRTLIRKLDKLRDKVGVPFILLSLNQGAHASKSFHFKNLAVDFAFGQTRVDNQLLYKIVRHALDLGFRGVGLYRNAQGVWSVHLDLREETTVWVARKGTKGQWVYSEMLWGVPNTN